MTPEKVLRHLLHSRFRPCYTVDMNSEVYALAKSMRDDEALRNQPYLDAIAQYGGVTPDLIWDPKRGKHGEYVLAGEYEDVPDRMLAVTGDRTVFRGVRINGNADEIADTLRAQGYDVTDGDVREFLRTYRRVTIVEFLADAREAIAAANPGPMSSRRMMAVEDMLVRMGFEQTESRWGRPSYVRAGSDMEVNVGPMTTCIIGANLPPDVRRNHTGEWAILATGDVRNIEVTLASALFNELAA